MVAGMVLVYNDNFDFFLLKNPYFGPFLIMFSELENYFIATELNIEHNEN